VVAWTPGQKLLANASIPCLHADPYYGTIMPGASASATGIILFTEASLEGVVGELRKAGAGAPPGKTQP
jgi:hypothetical protein